MPSQNKLIKEGIKYSDSLFKEIAKRLSNDIRQCDTLEEFLEMYNRIFPEKGNPLISVGYDQTLVKLILAETNNHKFSKPAQKEMTRTVIENIVGNHIADIGEDLRVKVRDVVKEGYDNQLPQEQIAENLTATVESINNTRARATARTEIARTATVSDYIVNVERGATHFKVDCRGTCCEVCEEMYHWGDETYTIDQTDMLPPIHPNCRCTAFFFSEDNEPTDLKNDSLIRKEIRELRASDIPNAEERIRYFQKQL